MKKEETDYGMPGLFPQGYVIELGNGRYFQGWKKRSICCVPLQQARIFPKQGEAETYVRKYFGYYGMEAHVCRLCWVLVSWEDMAYWNGGGFTSDLSGAVQFADPGTASRYQRRHRLGKEAYLDYAASRVQRICPAA